MKQFILISYDISNDRNRLKVMKALEDYGRRVQYSVFECCLTSPQLQKLKLRLQPLVNPKAWDSIRFYFLCVEDVPRTEIIGKCEVTTDRSFYMQ